VIFDSKMRVVAALVVACVAVAGVAGAPQARPRPGPPARPAAPAQGTRLRGIMGDFMSGMTAMGSRIRNGFDRTVDGIRVGSIRPPQFAQQRTNLGDQNQRQGGAPNLPRRPMQGSGNALNGMVDRVWSGMRNVFRRMGSSNQRQGGSLMGR